MHHFLRWLRQHGASLDQLSQADVDHWTAGHLDQAVALAAFLRWAARRHHAPRGIRPPSRRDRTVRLSTGQDELYAAARRCLTDSTIPPGHRLAVGLVVLYGQPLTRICRLRVSDLEHHDDETTTITLGRTPLALLPPLAAVARTVADTALHDAVRAGVSTGFTDQPVWLFPGLPLTKHAHPSITPGLPNSAGWPVHYMRATPPHLDPSLSIHAMHVFRADTEDAATRLIRTLADTGLQPQLEHYGPRRIYVVVNSTRPDIVDLALSVGPTVRRVPTLRELRPREITTLDASGHV